MSKNTQNGISRRGVLRGMSAVSGAAMTGSVFSVGKANAAGDFEVTMQLGWLASNGILGEVAADASGTMPTQGSA